MEENEEQGIPYWLQTCNTQYHHRRRRSSSSLLLNPALLIVLLPTIILLLLFLVLPSLLPSASQNFRPNSVKRNWFSLNLLLLLFAVACGFLNTRNNDSSSTSSSSSSIVDEANGVAAHISQGFSEKSLQSTTLKRQWFEYSADSRIYDSVGTTTPDSISTNVVPLRSCSSYPNLRQEFSGVSGDDDKWRFFDDNDIDLNTYWSASEYVRRRQGRQSENEPSEIKTIPLDTFLHLPTETSSSAPPSPTPAQPPAPPSQPPSLSAPPASKHKTSRTFHSVERKEKEENPESRSLQPSSPSPPPPPSPPKPVLHHHRSEQKSGRSDKKRGTGAKDIANTLASLYHHRKKKKQKQNCKDNQHSSEQSLPLPLHSGSGVGLPPPSPPQPPSQPAPASIFQNLFSYKKTSKRKRIHSISQLNPSPSSPPPPPPKPWSLSRSTKPKSQIEAPAPAPEPFSDLPQQRQTSSAGDWRPPLPTKTRSSSILYDEDDNLNNGGPSPLIPIPPLQPRLPFRIVRGDFVSSSSPVGSPTMKKSESESESESESSVSVSNTSATTTMTTAVPAMIEGGDGSGAVSCPSRDVNTEADTFIARFRAGLRLEKMNSITEKQEAQSPSPNDM
ncbi:hypothetical protein NE237_027590 [Protea cynaroides]|uniref:Hydroxyproline-rich glycoprotein family protein n=1 Tax=Protea cynaroides TaxID=273540 RepID=A0A9Q0GNA0_9MAGN|nr:hypothetical protein NE237_027590 [Protea cynaroides]